MGGGGDDGVVPREAAGGVLQPQLAALGVRTLALQRLGTPPPAVPVGRQAGTVTALLMAWPGMAWPSQAMN